MQKSHLNKFMLKLKCSGYNQKFRSEVLESILNAYDKMVESDKTGAKPLYRSREWNAKERKDTKIAKKFNWWNSTKSKVQYKSVLFVTPTPGGSLQKK